MNKRQERAFRDDLFELGEEYFKKHAKKMAKYEVTEQDIIEFGRSENLKYLEKTKDNIFVEKDKAQFALSISSCLLCFDPGTEYLNKLIELLELIVTDEYFEYLDAAITFQINDMCGGGIHTQTQNFIAADMKYLTDNLGFPNDNRWTVTEYQRFTGLVPYLFRNGYIEQYQRMIKYCLFLMERFDMKVGQMIFSLLNFLKKNDKENYEVVYNKFLEIKAKDDGPWTVERNFARFGLGFQMRRENWSHKSFMDFLD